MSLQNTHSETMQPQKEYVNGDACAGEGGGATEAEVCELAFEDAGLVAAALHALNMMRKNRHFCDVVLHTGTVEVPAHRAVLAAVSPYLFELFTTDQDRNGANANASLPLSYKLNGICEKRALLALVDYAYTGQLTVPAHHVRSVYLCAWQLRMDGVVSRCGDHLVSKLSLDTCIDVRSLPGLSEKQLAIVDKFIADNFSVLYASAALSVVLQVRLEILHATRADMGATRHDKIAPLALGWLREQIIEGDVSVSELSSRTHLLYVALDRSLRDCAALPPAKGDAQLLQDYRRKTAATVTGVKAPKKNGVPALVSVVPSNGTTGAGLRPRVLIYSHDIAERHQLEPDWAIVASDKVGEHTFLALSTLGGRLAMLSIALRLCESPLPSPAPAERETCGAQLAHMESPRCAHGTATLDGCIVVCGGYDRIECLKSCEKYDPVHNVWLPMPDMRQPRGRFHIAQVDSKLIAIGGSDGHVELDSVEMYEEPTTSKAMTTSTESTGEDGGASGEDDSKTNGHQANGNTPHPSQDKPLESLRHPQAWRKRARLPLARSHVAVCGHAGRAYVAGGWTGQVGVRQCHQYNVEQDEWSEMPPLGTGRYQASACVWRDALWVVGGCDSWHCLNTTEVFPLSGDNEHTAAWSYGPVLPSARRSCGVVSWRGALLVVGGSDGAASLRSVDALTAPGAAWARAPALREPRAALGTAVLGNNLYAVGGFSGKQFLSSIEYLSELSGEWTTVIEPFPMPTILHHIEEVSPPQKKEEEAAVVRERVNVS